MEVFLGYLVIISVIAVVVTIVDKRAAINHTWRISEKNLFLVATVGGALAMYITMQIIRHKTKQKEFMVGLPIIIAIQIYLVMTCL